MKHSTPSYPIFYNRSSMGNTFYETSAVQSNTLNPTFTIVLSICVVFNMQVHAKVAKKKARKGRRLSFAFFADSLGALCVKFIFPSDAVSATHLENRTRI